MNRIGRGSAWALRWFAKPFVKGSIPSTASKPDKALEWIFDPVGSPDEVRAMLKAAAYNKAYEPPQDLVLLAHALVWHLRMDRDQWKDAAIKARKALSEAKRGKRE